jgi:hypothetical protein
MPAGDQLKVHKLGGRHVRRLRAGGRENLWLGHARPIASLERDQLGLGRARDRRRKLADLVAVPVP